MRRLVNLFSAALMVAGLAILVYVGVTYASRQNVATPHWSAAQQQKGRALAHRLSHHQTVAIPKALQHKRLPALGSEPATRLVIPKISLHSPVIGTPPQDGVWPVVDWAVGHLSTSPNPGGVGNMALSAHDDIKGEVFKRLGELSPGDRVFVYTALARYTYVVVAQKNVDPSDVSVLNPTSTPTLTMVTCTPYWVDTQRLVVQAVLKARTAV
jgi:LPXTG-site transpeptidase (sortase) family protein